MKYKIKRFSDIIPASGAITGLAGGSYLGNKIHAKIDKQVAMYKFNPEKEAKKLEKESDILDKKANKLESDKEYMRRYKAADKTREEKYKRAEADDYNEGLMDEADEEFRNKVPEGNLKFIKWNAKSARDKANDIRSNPKKYKKEEGKNAEWSRNHNPGAGSIIGGLTGAIGGGILGSKIGKKK